MPGRVLLVATVALGVGNAPVLETVHREPLVFLNHSLAHCQSRVFREAVRKSDKHHLTGKPTDLMRQLVRICEQGGCILDPFAGSGITLVAADAEGYNWTGIEMTGHYFDVAKSRLSQV